MTISKIKKNSLEANIIDEDLLTADVITQQTELSETAADGDVILVYDTSAGVLKKIQKSNFTLQPPTFSSVSPTSLTSGDGTGNYTIVITGTNFTAGTTAKLLKSDGTQISFTTVTRDSSTQLTCVVAKSSVSNADEPFGLQITIGNGLAVTTTGQINVDAQPIWSTASGSINTTAHANRGSFSAVTVAAADPESGGDIVYTIESGSLPAGLSGASTSSGYVISGTPDAVGSDTTTSFTIRAADVNSNTADREFSITIEAPLVQTFTSSGTFSVPSGVSTVDVLVVAGGGGGPRGGGGAGGLIYRPGFPVTPGGTVSVTVGEGGANHNNNGPPGNGQDSVFGTLTAKGGGYGGRSGPAGAQYFNGGPGGSGGGTGGTGGNEGGQVGPGGSATQPTQGGDSGTYGFGNAGGTGSANPWPANPDWGGGGGGAGAAGQPAANGGIGGIGKAYTIADNTTSVYYAGGGSTVQVGSGYNPQGSGAANRGGGKGGGAGYKGVVIVRWS